jgi:protein-disulfide isomerase
VPRLDEAYIKTGKVRYAVRDLPLSIHRNAFKAAEATHCAADQGKYWEFHDLLFANQAKLNRQDLTAHARTLDLNVAAFDECVDRGKHAARIRKDVAETRRLGPTGTPTFLLGLTDPNSTQLKVVRVVRGAQAFSAFQEAIDSLLSSGR